MRKGIARLGLICSLSLFTSPGFAYSVSDLLISEVMANPAALSDSLGEWFELYNPTDSVINLRGLDLRDDGSNLHRFETDLLIPPQQYLTLARSATPGFAPDYVYDNFTLANSADEIVFHDGLVELLRLDYGSGFSSAGRSRELRHLPMLAANYDLALASLTYGLGDIGTPGSASGVLAPSTVPLPAGAWLFITGLLALFAPRIRNVVADKAGNRSGRSGPAKAAASQIPVAPSTLPIPCGSGSRGSILLPTTAASLAS